VVAVLQSPKSTVELRTVGVEAFDEIYPLLAVFKNPHMQKDDWRRMLFTYPWADPSIPQRGYALYAGGRAVGFMGTIFSKRELAGKTEPICSLSSWIVLPEHRDSSLKLVMPILRLKDFTVLNPTPSPEAYGIFKGLGFRPLETERLVLPPLPDMGDPRGALSSRIFRSHAALSRELRGPSRAIYDDLRTCSAARHILVRRGGRECYVVATAAHRRGLPFAEIQHMSDPEAFWRCRVLVHLGLFPSTLAAGLWVDKRFAPERRPFGALSWHSRRLYRPTRKEITPQMIDGLYSEHMALKW
jgi:hypothetical protein